MEEAGPQQDGRGPVGVGKMEAGSNNGVRLMGYGGW